MLHLAAPEVIDGDFADAVLAGLAAPQKVVPARFFYDMAGSELFEAITRLPEYYPTRTEIGILGQHAPDIAAIVGAGRAVVEFGSGSSHKTPPFLRAVAASAYVPVDISAEFLEMAATDLAAKLPDLPVFPLAADFTGRFGSPPASRRAPSSASSPGRRSATWDRRRRSTCCARSATRSATAAGSSSASTCARTSRFSKPRTTMPPGSPPRSTSTCWRGSTPNSTERST